MLRQKDISASDIARIAKNGQLSVLVGSGVSCACGLPSWNKLIREMEAELLRNCAKADRRDLKRFLGTAGPLKIAGLYKQKNGEVTYAEFLRARFRQHKTKPAPLLNAVARLPVFTYFTTNFDKLLETACRPRSDAADPIVVIDPSQLSALASKEKRIIKIHGDIDHPKSVVLTDDDYLHYADKYESLALYLTGHLAFSTLLLVGFGLRDPNFDRIYDGARKLVQGSGPRVIALMANQNSIERQTWATKGLLINDFDRYDDIPRFLNQIARAR
jgi:hypothetical protein